MKKGCPYDLAQDRREAFAASILHSSNEEGIAFNLDSDPRPLDNVFFDREIDAMDWELNYQNNDTPWERGEPAPPLVEYLETNQIGGRVLVPGCGLGHDVRLLAAHGCDALGVDLSSTALGKAETFPKPDGGSVSYQLSDFLDPENNLPDAHFDYVFEHTCFCAIDPSRRIDYLRAVCRVLKPGGHLLAILFTHLDGEEGPPFPTSTDEVQTLFASHFEIARHWRPTRAYAGRENEESMYLMKRR